MLARASREMLIDDGARVVITDIDHEKAVSAGVATVAPDELLTVDADVLAPCALGGVLTQESVGVLTAAVVCGAANNQLLDGAAADAVAERAIVYAPDYVVNAGGIINIAHEWHPDGYARERAYAQAARIEDTTGRVLALAREERIMTAHAAAELAHRRIAAEGHAPYRPGEPSIMRDALLARRERFR